MHIPARMLSHEDSVDNRRVQRMRASESAGSRVQRIYDISRYGCQIESNDLTDGANGQFLEIDFGNIITRAIIRWSDRARLGVEFARPLGSREVDALLAEPVSIRLRRL